MAVLPGIESRIQALDHLPDCRLADPCSALGFSQQAVFARWRHFLVLLVAVLAPITAGLVYVSWVALRKIR